MRLLIVFDIFFCVHSSLKMMNMLWFKMQIKGLTNVLKFKSFLRVSHCTLYQHVFLLRRFHVFFLLEGNSLTDVTPHSCENS